MNKTNITDHETVGATILERLASTKLTPAMKQAAQEFKKAHGAFTASNGAANVAKGARDEAVAAIGTADEALDAAVEVLAQKMIGAGMGTRANPFVGFSKLTPSAVARLPYAEEAKEVSSIVAKIKKSKASADVTKAAANCDKLAAVVIKTLGALTKPQLAYSKSLAARDALLLSWTKALTVLKKTAAVAWIDDDATYKSVFAAPAKVQAPVKKRGKATKKAAKAAKTETNGVAAGTVAKPAPSTTPAS